MSGLSKESLFSQRLEEASAEARRRPSVTLAYAQTLNGSIARKRGEPTSISCDESSRFTHALRGMHRGIAVGVETLLADDPRLTCRGVDAASPTPVIFDRRLRTPQTARVFSLHPLVCILTTEEALASGGSRYPRERTLLLPLLDPQGGSLELAGALEGLKERAGLDTLMVEGGGKLLASFLRSQLWDLAAVTIAPRYLGGYQIGSDLDEQVCVESVEKLGEDLLLIARREGRHE